MNTVFSRVWELLVNYSGLICLIDCVVLPALVFILGFLNIFSNFDAIERTIHIAEVFLIIPFGLISVGVNFKRTKNVLLCASGLTGICLVVLSHLLNDSLLHTVASLLGCFMLISSNYISRRMCRHDHGPNEYEMV